MKRCACVMFFFLSMVTVISAQSLVIYTENDPPSQFLDKDGKLTGYMIEVVQEIQKRVGNTDKVELVPWARGYDAIQKQNNVVLFSMTRTAERNPMFKWVGPTLESTSNLYAKADSKIKIAGMEEAKKLGKIGVYRDDVRDQILSKAGFTNLDRENDVTTNIKMLMGGRIDVYADSSTSFAANVKAAGFKSEDFKFILTFQKSQLFFAMSLKMPDSVVTAWNAALDTMKKDGTFEKMLKKYYPDNQLPGPAITAF